MKNTETPLRKEIPQNDTWDLTTLYKTDSDWESDINSIPSIIMELISFEGKLASSAKALLQAVTVYEKAQKILEKAGNYAFLLTAGDSGDTSAQEKHERFMMTYGEFAEKTSFFVSELQTIPESSINIWLTQPDFADYSLWIKKLLRLKAHILSQKEERIFALHINANETAHKTFSLLTNVDIDYGKIHTKDGEKQLTQSSWTQFMESEDRNLRKDAYNQFYKAFDAHKNTLSSLYLGSVHVDICNARARGYSSARQAALFADDVNEAVYDNLIDSIRSNFKPLHDYYALRKKALNVDELRHYDVYVPLVKNVQKTIPYTEAVEILREALSPLGSEYTSTLCNGLLNGWVDKYENKGKRSGAFSSGAYTGYPYILMNYKSDVLRDVFTLAHEGGHSMHSLYSAQSNPFMHYNYTIFEAEVASTFNEELLFRFLMKNERDATVKKYLLCNRASDILATLYRQTMFAEYEKITHQMTEEGKPLTTQTLRQIYRNLLKDYFGSHMIFEDVSDLECLRIPHFYSAFYVYKYATGISASLALAERVLSGGKKEKDDYFAFLKSGGSRYPIDSLKKAGVDMSKSAPIESAIKQFSSIVDELKNLI